MSDFSQGQMPLSGDDGRNSSADYLTRAAEACKSGDIKLGMHLYLAAFEQSMASGYPSEEVLAGLHQAWDLACQSKERALAEYIFEKMSPFLSEAEMTQCAIALQALAFDKLEEFGVSPEDLQEMAELFSPDMLDFSMLGGGMDGMPSFGFGVISDPTVFLDDDSEDDDEAADSATSNQMPAFPDLTGLSEMLRLPDFSPESMGTPSQPMINLAAFGAQPSAKEKKDAVEDSNVQTPSKPKRRKREESPATFLAKAAAELERNNVEQGVEDLSYDTLAGYKGAIRAMRDLGVGMKDNQVFKELVDNLNERHGLTRMPASDAILLRSPVREDANRFMQATVGELRQPVVHMNMEENFAGVPLLCVTAASMGEKKLSALRNAFVSGGVIVLEDIDLWAPPSMDTPEDPASFFISTMSRGARDALSLVQAAVDNPEIMVLATASTTGEIDPFFLEMLEPLTVIEIEYPTEEERKEIWIDIAKEHPSIRHIPISELSRLSASMARYDIYMAVREAIEEAYKAGLMNRSYVPVSRENLFEKLAAYQPLDSEEYQELENAVLDDFRADLEHLDDLLN